MKSPAQAGSLGTNGVKRMIQDIRITKKSPCRKNSIKPYIVSFKKRFEQLIATSRILKVDKIITQSGVNDELCHRIPIIRNSYSGRQLMTKEYSRRRYNLLGAFI